VRAKHKTSFQHVPVPESNVSISNINNNQYVYHIGKGYRNSKGQPTSKRLSIGKLDDNGMLIPNENYFAIYDLQPPIPQFEIDSILNFGSFFLLDHISKDIGLASVIRNIFGDMGDEIMVLAIYLALTGQAFYRCDAWCRETLTGRPKAITSQRITRILESINEKKRMDFFRAWVHARQQREYLAYDVTSISSYARGSDLVEHGYNRDNEGLPQINLGMYYGEESLLPIFYCTYKGSIVDKSHLPYIMKYNEDLGIKDVCFVMDRGFFSESNVRNLAFKHRFIMGISNSLVVSKDAIKKYGQQVMSSRYDIGLTGVKGLSIEDARYDFRSKIHLFYSNDKIADEERYLKSKLSDWEKELEKGNSVKAAEDYFHITGSLKDNDLVVTRNHDAIDEKIRNLGYFLMMTTDLNKTSGEILNIYRQKDVIEKCFDELKNDLDMKRLRVHSDVVMEGKMFIAFIGLILRTYVHNKLRDYLELNRPISMPQIYDELRMIKTVKTKTGMVQHNPLTKKQRQILEEFGITDEVLGSAIYKYAGINPNFEN